MNAPAFLIKVELLEAQPQSQDACRLCGASLKPYEKSEAICNGCLRAHQWKAEAA